MTIVVVQGTLGKNILENNLFSEDLVSLSIHYLMYYNTIFRYHVRTSSSQS